MKTYEISLTVETPPNLGEGDKFLDLADKIYAAFDGDVEVEMIRGALCVRVTREEATMIEVIRSSIRALSSVGLRLAHLAPESLVSAAQIAERLHVSRERVGQLLKAGELPPPLALLEDRSPLYRWADVVKRLAGRERVKPEEIEAAESIEKANAAVTFAARDPERMLEMLA